MQIVRESIFSSAIRSFFSTLLAMLGILIALFLVIAIFITLGRPYTTPSDAIEMEILPDAQGNTELLAESHPIILRLDITGVIGEEDHMSSESIQSYLNAAKRGIFKNRVKAIMLYISSPGGSATESDLVYNTLKRFKEKTNIPIYAFTPDICASGGYYIACAADKIFAAPIAIVGSCGVKFGPNFNFYEFLKTHGIMAKTFADGKNKDKLPLFEPWDNSDTKEPAYQDILDTLVVVYDRFVDIVNDARSSHGLTTDRLKNVYGASVYAGTKAKELGYIDEISLTYEDTLKNLASSASLETYQVIRLSRRPSAISSLISGQLSLWTNKTKSLLLGLPVGGRFENKPLYYYDNNR